MTAALAAFLLAFASPQEPASQPAAAQSRPTIAALDAMLEQIDLRDISLRDALRLVSEETGVNLAASEEAASKNVSMFLQNTSVRHAIETLAKSYGLWYREDRTTGVVRVMSTAEFDRDLALFRDEETRVFTLLYPNSLDVAFAIRNLFGSRVQLSLDREYQFDEYTEIQQRFQKFNLLQQQAQNQGTFSGGTTNFIGSNGYASSSGYGSGIYGGLQSMNQGAYQQPLQYPQPNAQTKKPEPLTSDQIEALQQAQAESGGKIDAALLQQLSDKKTSIYVSVIRRSNMIAARTSDASAMREVERIVRALDVPTPQVLLEVKILTLDLSDEFNSAFDFGYSSGGSSTSFTTGDIASGGGLVKPNGFIYQYVNDHFQARLQLLEEKKRVSTVASPILLVANNEVSRVFVGEEVPVVLNISSQTTVNQNVVTTSPSSTTEIRPVGTTLLITPNVNADRTVTLRVLQETSDVNKNGASIPVVTSIGTVVNQPVDTIRERTVSGTVVAKDGLTLALGGLVEEAVGDSLSGIPGLMDLPLIGVLFRRETKTRSRRELVVLIRPFVLFTANEGNEMSRELANRLSIHSSAASLGQQPFDSFRKDEAPKPPLASDPLREILKPQSGLPDGR